METELGALYNVISFYKKSLIENLSKIDNNLLQVVNNETSPKKKYQLSIHIVGMFSQYSRMLHIVEGLVEEFKTVLAGWECDCEPEKDSSFTNPFKQWPEPENESYFESETNTLVNEEDSTNSTVISKVFDNFKQEVVDSEICTLESNQNVIFDPTPVLEPQENCFNFPGTSTSFVQNSDAIKLENEDFQVVDSPPEKSNEFSSNLYSIKQEAVENCLQDPVEVGNQFQLYSSNGNSPETKLESLQQENFSTSLDNFPDNSFENSVRESPKTRPETPPNVNENSVIDSKPSLTSPVNNFDFPEKPREHDPEPPPRNEFAVSKSIKKKKKPDKNKQNGDFSNFEYVFPSSEAPPTQKTRHVTFKIDETKSSEENSAVRKIMQLPPNNWREEAQRLFENQTKRKTFKWVSSPVQNRSSTKKREKFTIFEIFDNDLSVRQSCVFCHVESPSEFYIRTDQMLFEGLENALNEDLNQHQYVVNKFSKKVNARNSLGNFCFGYLTTRRKWFRLEVLDWMLDEPDRISVQMIDYGETFFWSFSQLKPMTEFYAMFPKMAIRCHLAGIFFSTNPQNKTNWPKSSTDFFIDLTEMKKMTKFTTIYVQKDGNSYAVDLQKENCEGGTLGHVLVDNGHASEVQIAEDDFLNGHLSLDKIDHQVMLPPSGTEVSIVITGYIDTCHFYAQIMPNEDFTGLLEFMNTTQTKPFESLPKISQYLVVKQDAHSLRATCVSHIDEDTIEVFLVDFGKTITVKIEDIRHMKEEFLSVPFQAVECILHDCQENIKTPRDNSRKFFDFCMHTHKFRALVVESGKPLKLKMWDSHNMDMSYVLKQCGIGECRVDFHPNM